MNNSTDTNARENEYFDFHMKGLGYLNRFRAVPVQKGNGYFAVDIAALEGDKSSPTTVRIDANVSGAEACNALDTVKDDIHNPNAKVLAGFTLGGLYPQTFTYKNGDKAGQTGISLKSRLIRIAWIKVKSEGSSSYETVYTAPKSDENQESEAALEQAA